MQTPILENMPVPNVRARPAVYIWKCSVKHRDRTRMSKLQRDKILAAIEKKILDGKHLCKVIQHELIRDGLITDDKENGDIPYLKVSRIAQYIKASRVKLNINLPYAKFRILELHDRMIRSSTARKKITIHCGFIAQETGCTEEWVREVLHREGKLVKRTYKKPSKINMEK